MVKKAQDASFDLCVRIFGRESLSMDAIVDQMFSFLSHKDNILTALNWLEHGQIQLARNQSYPLSMHQKHAILKGLYKSPDFTSEFKELELVRTVGQNSSDDFTQSCKAHCEASLPDPQKKSEIWNRIVDPNNNDSSIIKASRMAGFMQKEQVELLEPYFDQFFDALVMQS